MFPSVPTPDSTPPPRAIVPTLSGVAAVTPSAPAHSDVADAARTLAGAAAAGGVVVGAAAGSVVLGVGAAGAAAYAATRPDGIGDAARGVGRATARGAERANEINEEHKITERAGKAAADAWSGLQRLNEEHRLVERAGDAARAAGDAIGNFCAWAREQHEAHQCQQGRQDAPRPTVRTRPPAGGS